MLHQECSFLWSIAVIERTRDCSLVDFGILSTLQLLQITLLHLYSRVPYSRNFLLSHAFIPRSGLHRHMLAYLGDCSFPRQSCKQKWHLSEMCIPLFYS